MIKDTLLFLWIFVIPILIWLSQLFFYPKAKKQKINLYSQKILKFFLTLEVVIYLIGFSQIMDVDKNKVMDYLYFFCLFQIILLDIFCSIFALVNNADNRWSLFLVKRPKQKYGLFYFLFFVFYLIIIVFLAIFHFISMVEIFTDRMVPLSVIIFVLLFNPIYMFYQLRERLFKHD